MSLRRYTMKQLFTLCAVIGVLLSLSYAVNSLHGTNAALPAEAATPVAADNYLPEIAPVGATLLDGLGQYSLAVTTANASAQRWFDQAIMLTYGFNHQAAERSFLKAVELDPQCAMCWWGAALVLGPHVNAGMDPANNKAAWQRLQAAKKMAHLASPWEQAFIHALAARYAQQPPADRTVLDNAYADAMSALAQTLPDNLDAATLYAESLMNLQPWDYWDETGKPKGNTSKIVQLLESIIARNAEHAGALHLYIHAVEASNEPERGAMAADRLRTLIPGSGHLVHMPAHIYARVGRWHDAVIANQRAITADNNYLAACRPSPGVYPLGYVPHNHHFLWFASTMAGNRKIALAAADSTSERTSDPALMRTAGMEAMQNFAVTPLFAKVRFGQWQAIKQAAKPAADLPYMVAIWHYAQGMAALRSGEMPDARAHHVALLALVTEPALVAMKVWNRYSLSHGVSVAERMLAAELAWAAKEPDKAFAALQQAMLVEDNLPYDEPPAWHAPVRHTLGAMLLEAGRAEEAEQVYRSELRRNPENGWSLFGLEQALRAQSKTADADSVAVRFKQAFAHADITLTSSRF
jgi:tetratricopeptide (TPR) repeat protein